VNTVAQIKKLGKITVESLSALTAIITFWAASGLQYIIAEG
jgi:hypothetical protein